MTTNHSSKLGDDTVSIETLSDIPGVGAKLRKTLVDHFGSEAIAIKVILDFRVDLVASVPGIGDKQAVNIVKAVYEDRFGVTSYDILRSPDIRRIFDDLLDIIRSYANTTYARDKLFLYFPLPPDRINEILKRQQIFADAAEMARNLDERQRKEITANLGKVRSLYYRIKPRRIEGRVVITKDERVFDKLIQDGIDKWCPVYILSEGESGIDYAQGYDLVFYIAPFGDFDETLDMLDNVEVLGKDWSTADILPEQTINFYSRNYRVIEAACKLADAFADIPKNDTTNEYIENLDFESLSQVGNLLQLLDEDGNVAAKVNQELDRYRHAVKAFPTAIAETEAWLNDKITSRISKSEVKLGGQQIITILQSADMEGADGGAMRNMLPAEIVETFSTTAREAEDKLVEMLGLTVREADWATGIVSEDISLPVKMLTPQINDLEDKLRRRFADLQFSTIKKVAGQLDELQETVNEAVQALLEFDLYLAVGLFAADYDLHTPSISMDYKGVAVKNARNIFLIESMLKGKHGKVQPINYTIGDTPFKPDGTNGENCAILSGANSGGKTTTIQTLAQVITLAQTGFPVPAEVSYIRVFEELYFFYKSRGMVSAGAFEATLKQFADIVVSNKSKLALFDEVEAITEPGSAANVIAGLIEILQRDPSSVTVICSHLAHEIQESAAVPVRIDGIEARGLDENLELIVDRSPRFGVLARSTPELIVERLSKLARGEKKFVYEKILDNLMRDRE